jgi:hypothetical protein
VGARDRRTRARRALSPSIRTRSFADLSEQNARSYHEHPLLCFAERETSTALVRLGYAMLGIAVGLYATPGHATVMPRTTG